MMEPNDVGPLDLSLGHFNSVVIINTDASLALEYPKGSLKLCENIQHRAHELYDRFFVPRRMREFYITAITSSASASASHPNPDRAPYLALIKTRWGLW
jgi:hypothetical protein